MLQNKGYIIVIGLVLGVARDADVNEQREMRLLVRLGNGLPGAVVITPVDGLIVVFVCVFAFVTHFN